jgi:hypothetical protein
MKTMTIIKTAVLGLSLAFATNKIIAQDLKPAKESGDYTNAFGLRGGETSGLTFKHKFENNNAMEFILGTSPFALSLTGLYEKYVPTGARGLQCYFGGGGHIANQYNYTRYYDYYRDRYYYRTYYNGPAVGIDGIMGIEYKIPKAPFAFSFDLKPNFEVAPGSPIYGSIDPGLGVKLAF